MAGVHIELKRLLRKEGLWNLFLASAYSSVLSSGNWVLAIFTITFFSYISAQLVEDPKVPEIYQTYITYTVALSLITSGPLQLMFTRYVADRLFEHKDEKVRPNYLGALMLTMAMSFTIAFLLSFYLFEGLPYYYHLLFSFTVSVLGGLWLTNALLTGLKSYKHILFSFAFSYLLMGVLLVYAVRYGFWATFLVFYVGNCLLLFLLALRVIKDYGSEDLLDFEFLSRKKSFYSLAFIGLFYNLAIWIDKFVFWFSPLTGEPVFANIRASVLYDIPVIFAYLSLIPGIAVFFMKLEVEFAYYYDQYYDAVREWGTLEDLYRLANKMIDSAKALIYETLRVQFIFSFLLFLLQENLFKLLKISYAYLPLLNVLMVGAILQLAFMVIFALLSYFDRRKEMLIITSLFFLLNFTLSLLTQFLSPFFYGYGYTVSLLISDFVGLILLRRFLHEVHYRTYMLSD